jgi:hypothetical protein
MSDDAQMITIDGKEYNFEELEDKQKIMVNHVSSLNTRIAQARFDLDQLSVAQNAFSDMLVASINEAKPEPEKSKK